MSEENRERGGLVGPVILIGFGVILLLNNLGVVDWSIWWTILRIWPAWLIAIGVDLLIGRRSWIGSLIALVLIAGIFAGAFWLASTDVGPTGEGEQIRQELGDAERATVRLNPALGEFELNVIADTAYLITGEVRLAGGGQLESSFETEDGEAEYTLETTGSFVGPFFGGASSRRLWDLSVKADVPLTLRVSQGLGECTLDLTGATLEDVSVDMGLGRTVVALPAEGRYTGRIDGAIGETVIEVPEGVGVRVRLDTGITARSLPDDFTCEDNVCTSEDYSAADHRADLTVGQAIGQVVIRRE